MMRTGKISPAPSSRQGPVWSPRSVRKEVDGYDAIQLAFDDAKEKHTNKPMKGHFAKAGAAPKRILQGIYQV